MILTFGLRIVSIIVVTLIVGMANIVQASFVPPTPEGLNPGDQYRWVFVTSGAIDGQSSDIDYYNNVVDDLGDTVVNSDWKAIVSIGTQGNVANVHAKDNTGTNLSDSNIPIFNFAGKLVSATDSVNMWQDGVSNAITIDESGASYDGLVWTGTNKWGSGSAFKLGRPPFYKSTTSDTAADLATYWTAGTAVNNKTNLLPLYGISSVQTMSPVAPIPEPASVITWTLLGVVGCIATWWRRRRRAG